MADAVSSSDAVLVHGVSAQYGSAAALHDVDIRVRHGTTVALLGSNGAGKTTILRAIMRGLGAHRGAVTAGEIWLDGWSTNGARPDDVVRRGTSIVLEGRRVFSGMTVEDNLRVGGLLRSRRQAADAIESVYDDFPVLAERRDQRAGYLSGGEQQMLAIGRALIASPRILLLDEPTLGLAPLIIEQIAEAIVRIRNRGTSVLLVEQNAHMALSIADEGYVVEAGRIVQHGTSAELLADADIQRFYLGTAPSAADVAARLDGRDHDRWIA
jgi:branched-chain amino acid transport system ATP-binding protein